LPNTAGTIPIIPLDGYGPIGFGAADDNIIAASADTLDILSKMGGNGPSGYRKYQILVQKFRLWECPTPARRNIEGNRGKRAIIRTYHIYNNGDLQISPFYLTKQLGKLIEIPIVYPAYPTIGNGRYCSRISTCFNTGKVTPYIYESQLPCRGSFACYTNSQ